MQEMEKERLERGCCPGGRVVKESPELWPQLLWVLLRRKLATDFSDRKIARDCAGPISLTHFAVVSDSVPKGVGFSSNSVTD